MCVDSPEVLKLFLDASSEEISGSVCVLRVQLSSLDSSIIVGIMSPGLEQNPLDWKEWRLSLVHR